MNTRFQQLGRSLLLTALVLGLNVLGVLAITHARHPNHARANVAHAHGSSVRRATRDQAGADAEDEQAPHVAIPGRKLTQLRSWTFSHLSAFAMDSARLFAPEFIPASLDHAPLVATGSAPRAPGAPRGPPTA